MDASEETTIFASLLSSRPAPAELTAERQHELILRGIVAELEESAASDQAETAGTGNRALELLRETAARHPLEGVRGQAFQALLRLSRAKAAEAVDAVYRLAVEDNLLAARQQIIANKWQPENPGLRALFDWFTSLESSTPYPVDAVGALTQAYMEEASAELRRRLLATAPQVGMEDWSRIVHAVQVGEEHSLGELTNRYPLLRGPERSLALDLLEQSAAQGSQPAREAITQLFLRLEDPRARQIALSNGYLPEDPEQRALFLFLAEAWQQYETFDFNHALLTSAYAGADRSLRRRLLEHSRHTGQMEWLRELNPTGEVRWLNDLTDADWEITIRRLKESERPEDLWRLAQVAPPVWSAAVLEALSRLGWQPEGADEREGFARLSSLARDSLASPLAIHPRKAYYVPAADLISLCMHPNGQTLAAGTTDQRIFQWKTGEGDLREPPLIGPSPVARALAFSPDGQMLASASSDHRIRVYRLQDGQLLKTLEGHSAMIRALAVQADNRTLYSTGFDGTIRFWRFPFGPTLKTIKPGGGEIFSMAVGSAGSYLLTAGADCLVRVWSLPEGGPVREMKGHKDTITHLAASPSSDLVASAGRDGVINLWNYTSGGLVRSIENTAGPLTTLTMHPNDQVLIGGRSSGEITLWNLSTGRVIERLTDHHKPVSGLVLSPNGDTLYSSDSGGNLNSLKVWDLRVFLTIRLPGEVARPGAADHFQEQLKNPHLSSAEKKWLLFSAEQARWRQRFDIEISEFAPIAVGEFDIEIS